MPVSQEFVENKLKENLEPEFMVIWQLNAVNSI